MMPRPKPVWITSTTSLHAATTGHEKDEPLNENIGTKLRAAVYQPPITLPDDGDNKTSSAEDNPLTVLTKVADVLVLAARCGIDVVQFPELFLNGGLCQNVVSGRSAAPLDRESYALNIVGNLCEELNIACVMGYAEAGHESEGTTGEKDLANGVAVSYSSLAIFHADGTRAGNYRCLHPSDPSTNNNEATSIAFEKGHSLVEAMPISVRLPVRQAAPTLQERISVQQQETAANATTTTMPREVKLGAMCGGDLLVPEHARHLARSGAEMLVVSGSLSEKNDNSRMVAKHVLPSRSMENELPLLFSNYVDDEKDDNDDEDENASAPCFIGQSTILSCDGIEIVRAPESLYGDMPPSEEGYLLPCETGGALYAADLEIRANGNNSSIEASIDKWDIAPRIDQLGAGDKKRGTKEGDNEKGFRKEPRRKTKGFGREVVEALEQSKKKKLRLKNK
jgi:predicted amidohydrolase